MTQPPALDSKWEGTMKVTPAIARPGEGLALSFPEDSFRGVGFSLERWVGNAWQVQFYLSFDGADRDWTPEWWRVEDAEGHYWPDVGVGGPGPDHVLVPDTAASETYRICTANAPNKACALLTVAS